MPRFIALANGDLPSFRLATLFQMTYPGAPCIYYGDEVGMQGGQRNYPEASRYSFNWDPASWDHELLSYIKRCTALRQAHPALRTGEFLSVYAQDQVYVYMRRLAHDQLLVILNNGEEDISIPMPSIPQLPSDANWDMLFDEGRTEVLSGNEIQLGKRSGIVLGIS
jgi:neopullulanase